MPAIIGTISAFAAAYVGGGVAVSTAVFYAVSGAIYAGLSVGLSLVSNALMPRAPSPKPEDVQTNFRQPTPVRTALYGEGLLGGPWVFGGIKDGDFFRVVALSSRELSSIDQIWVDDIANVSFSGSPATGTWVTTSPYGDDGSQRLYVEYRLGANPSSDYGTLIGAGVGWTSDHRGDGVASIFTIFRGVLAQEVQKFWPNGVNTLIRAKASGCVVYDPTDVSQDIDDSSTWTYSDNAARVIFDYMRHADGFRIPDSLIATPQALEGWEQATDDSDDAIALKAGGTEPRYRIWGTYSFAERPADVLSRFMSACDGRLKPVSDGGYTLEVGKWRAPTITIDEAHIVGFDGLARGRDILQTANTIYSQYTSSDHEYQGADAQPWIDSADVTDRGEIAASIDFINAPSHGQCRRLMKIEAHRSNPDDVATFILNKAGISCFGERFITISYSDLDVAGTFEVLDFQFLFGEHGILQGCSITVQSFDSSAYSWTAATEEGEPGGTENPPSENPYDAPALTLTMQAGGDALLEWADPGTAAFSVTRIEYQNTTTMGAVQETTALPADESATISGLTSGSDYQFRIRHEATLSVSSWSDWEEDTALA